MQQQDKQETRQLRETNSGEIGQQDQSQIPERTKAKGNKQQVQDKQGGDAVNNHKGKKRKGRNFVFN